MALPIPIRQRQGRMQEHGKIKIGVFAQGRPQAIETFRFTSHDPTAIDQLAALYGGKPKHNGKLWEVTTNAHEIDIVLVPNPLNGTPIYEQWSGGGMKRRCDGETCTRMVEVADDILEEPVPCVSAAAGALTCQPTVRLSVILPTIRMGGVWNLMSHSEAAMDEMEQFVDVIDAYMGRGLTKAKLAITNRESRGGRRKYKVPTLIIDHNILELVSGEAQLQARALAPPPGAVAGELTQVTQQNEDRTALNARMAGLAVEERAKIIETIRERGHDTKTIPVQDAQAIIDEVLDAPWDAEIVDQGL